MSSTNSGPSVTTTPNVVVQAVPAGSPAVPFDPSSVAITGGKVGPFFIPQSNDETGIRAARALAVAAGGGAILLPDATITLSASLPADKYVRYYGVAPRVSQGVIPDNPWTFTGGTVFVGDGTFPAFAGNTTPAGSPLAVGAYGNNGIVGFGAQDIGFSNFSKAVAIGATNVAGLIFGFLTNLWARECTNFAFDLVNIMHSPVDRLFACISSGGTGHGTRIASDQPTSTLMTGNMTAERLYVYQGNVTGRGIVFEAMPGAVLNEVRAQRIQCNRFNGTTFTQAATMANTSANITVTDGTKFAVGLPVFFSASVNGFTQDLAYVVLTVAGNVITVGNSKYGAAITATGATAINVSSNGMPNVEIVGASAGTVTQSRFLNIDAEGQSTAQIYLENVSNLEVDASEIATTGSSQSNIVARTAQFCRLSSLKEAITDFDGGCFNSSITGTVKTHRNRRMYGLSFEHSQSRPSISLFDNGGTTPDVAALSLSGGGVIQMNRALTKRVASTLGTTTTLDAGRAGVLPVSTSGITLTLPTITNASTQTSMIGLEFEIVNFSAGTITINTDGTMTLNGTGTTTTIAANSTKRFVALSTTTWGVF